MYYRCLQEGNFCNDSKQTLILLRRGNKTPEEPSSFSTLTILEEAGKLLERNTYIRTVKTAETNSKIGSTDSEKRNPPLEKSDL